MYLFDSDILIDYVRLYRPSLAFFEKLIARDRAISFLSQFELLHGCRTKEDEKIISRFLKKFRIVPLTPSVSKTALTIYKTKRWHTHIGIPDSFIAATALVNKLTLLTRNEKHYRGIPSLKVKKPYD